jgi:hypothetical protein
MSSEPSFHFRVHVPFEPQGYRFFEFSLATAGDGQPLPPRFRDAEVQWRNVLKLLAGETTLDYLMPYLKAGCKIFCTEKALRGNTRHLPVAMTVYSTDAPAYIASDGRPKRTPETLDKLVNNKLRKVLPGPSASAGCMCHCCELAQTDTALRRLRRATQAFGWPARHGGQEQPAFVGRSFRMHQMPLLLHRHPRQHLDWQACRHLGLHNRARWHGLWCSEPEGGCDQIVGAATRWPSRHTSQNRCRRLHHPCNPARSQGWRLRAGRRLRDIAR